MPRLNDPPTEEEVEAWRATSFPEGPSLMEFCLRRRLREGREMGDTGWRTRKHDEKHYPLRRVLMDWWMLGLLVLSMVAIIAVLLFGLKRVV